MPMDILKIFVPWCIVIFVIIMIVKRKKKAKQEELDAQKEIDSMIVSFKEDLRKRIEKIENDDSYFENIYSYYMEWFEVDRSAIDELMSKIPQLREQFRNSCNSIMEIADKNLYLNKNLEKELNLSYLEEKEMYTRNTIELLPILADYYEPYNQLYKLLFHDFLSTKLLDLNSHAFGILLDTSREIYDEENYEKVLQHHMEYVSHCFNIEVDHVIRRGFSLDNDYNVRNSDDPQIKILLKAVDETDLRTKYEIIWFHKMQATARPYMEAHTGLFEFFDEIRTQMKQHIEGYHFPSNMPPYAYDLSIEKHTKEDYLRISHLYQTGQMQGQYYEFKDPMYQKS